MSLNNTSTGFSCFLNLCYPQLCFPNQDKNNGNNNNEKISKRNAFNWSAYWFDSAHQHFIFYNKYYPNDVYISSTNIDENNLLNTNKNAESLLTNDFKKISLDDAELTSKTSVIHMKLSVDSQLLAVQLSLSTIVIYDIETKRKYSISIKISSDSDNKILPEGLIWSEHGGNSQDLIIVTIRGLELHKISSSRNQCKLSRAITQHCYAFWYEPNHRMMLIASPSFRHSTNSINRGKPLTMLMMYGIFFRVDKSEHLMPKLELPPPVKSPRFDIGPGVSKENITLVTLYGLLYCVALQRLNDEDYLVLYHVTKSTVTCSLLLALHCSNNILKTSVVDNILVCHCLSSQKAVLFDVKLRSTVSGNRGRYVIINGEDVEVLSPICPPSDIAYDNKTIPNQLIETIAASLTNSLSPTNISIIESHAPTRKPSFVIPSTSIRESDVGIRPSEVLLNINSTLDHMPVAAITVLSSNVDSNPIKSNGYNDSLLSNNNQPRKWQVYPPNWMLNTENYCIWRLELDILQISNHINDTKKCLLFLIRRGQLFQAPRPVYHNIISINEINIKTKELILVRLMNSLQMCVGLSWLDMIYKTLIQPYSNQFKYIENYNNECSQNFPSILDNISDNKVSSNSKNTTNKRKTSISNNFINFSFPTSITNSLTLSSSNPNSNQSIETIYSNDNNYPNVPTMNDLEPMEISEALHLFLPDITAISSRNRSLKNNESLSIDLLDLNKSENRLIHTTNLPFSIRRSFEGDMIISQTDMLSYIWIPLINSNKVNVSYYSWSLSSYIAALRSDDLSVHPGLSILLLHVLASQKSYLNISRLLQLQYFPDSKEMAMAALELADIITDTELGSNTNNNKIQNLHTKSAVNLLKQVSLDMLWRIQEHVTVVRWMLGHGKVIEAISLCLKKRVNHVNKSTLSYTTIPATEFFIAAIKKITYNYNYSMKYNRNKLLLFEDDNKIEENDNDNSDNNDNNEIIQTSPDSYINSTYKSYNLGENIEILQTVYDFIREWDPSSLFITASGKSKIASQCIFPNDSNILGNEISSRFKQLFGFPLT